MRQFVIETLDDVRALHRYFGELNACIHPYDCITADIEDEDGNKVFTPAEARYYDALADIARDVCEAHDVDIAEWVMSDPTPPRPLYIVTYVGLSDDNPDANGYTKVYRYYNYTDAVKARERMAEEEMQTQHEAGFEPRLVRESEAKWRVLWCGDCQQVILQLHIIVTL